MPSTRPTAAAQLESPYPPSGVELLSAGLMLVAALVGCVLLYEWLPVVQKASSDVGAQLPDAQIHVINAGAWLRHWSILLGLLALGGAASVRRHPKRERLVASGAIIGLLLVTYVGMVSFLPVLSGLLARSAH